MADFDAIVVGAGCAGSVAAYELASAGKSVLVVERGNFAGAKNMTGGRIYSHALKLVFPNFEEEAPLERRITHERISLMSDDANFTIDFSSKAMKQEGRDSYSVLRGPFDQWLAGKAEEAGAEFIYGIAVESLVKDDAGKICGVRAGEDEITAEVVLLCDGVNSLLTAEAVGAKRPPASAIAVGIKEVIELPASVITDRVLAASDDEGAAWLIAGDSTKGTFGGGFMYTNRESISLGVVAGIEATATHGRAPVYQMLEDLKSHDAVAPLIQGGKVVEHSGHMVPEGGYDMVPQYVFDGALLAGEAAGLCMNMGYQVRGMDFAVASGRMAAEAAVEAIDAGDASAAGLSGYARRMEDSFVIKDLKTFRKWPHVMEEWDAMFNDYPTMAAEVFNAMFSVDGRPQEPLRRRIMPIIKKRGLFKTANEVRKAVSAL